MGYHLENKRINCVWEIKVVLLAVLKPLSSILNEM